MNRTKQGSRVEIESSANPILMNDELVGFLAVQRDITNRKATEAALRESVTAASRTLAEAAHDSIFIVNRDATIQYANAASAEPLRRTTGRNDREATPRRVLAVCRR